MIFWKIFKYPLTQRRNVIEMPDRAKIVAVQMQSRVPTMWVAVDTDREPVKRRFGIFATGEEINCMDWVYFGTVQDDFGYVWHVVEDVSPQP